MEYNKSRTYIVPLLNESININKNMLINSYLFDVNRPDYNAQHYEGIFLHFKWIDNDVYRQYEKNMSENPLKKDYYDLDKTSYMMFIKFPYDILSDVDNIIKGKYSMLTTSSKQYIAKYWQLSTQSKMYGVLYKTEKYKKELEIELNVKIDDDAELGSLFNLHKETYSEIIKNKEVSV